jgi:Zn-dependent membrane protease YugP
MIFDPLYLILVFLPGLVLSGLASMYVKSTFNRFSRIRSGQGYTGAQAAYEMLKRAGVSNVGIEQTGGFLGDHYDPRTRTLRLSRNVYASQSLAAVGVACHEAGHALQHAHGYGPLKLRTALVPAAAVGSNMAYIFVFMGMLFRAPQLYFLGALVFAAAVIFSIITLPVEWDASARAKRALVTNGIVTPQEQTAAAKVLNAAFMTYIAAAVTAVLTLLYYLLRSGVLGGDE